ncbi:hypothetical protein HK105_202414 [Polyrhizophydium stewartii]|uniref:Uncharacterized protein n=1 Tax=Polyrhizophydium stewartii TaxID=2732419 RepID=A0ABR4NES5_9FUNG|nr:hypothetical protein HK105_003406 [Polyrhizophydium stewartii]
MTEPGQDTADAAAATAALGRASRLFAHHKLAEAQRVCETLVVPALAALTAEQRQLALLLLLRVARSESSAASGDDGGASGGADRRWAAQWERVVGLAGGIHMLSGELLLVGALAHVKARDHGAARGVVEQWLAAQADEFFQAAAAGTQPSARTYERVVELYMLALAGLRDYEAAAEFLKYNTVLPAKRREMLEASISRLQLEAAAACMPAPAAQPAAAPAASASAAAAAAEPGAAGAEPLAPLGVTGSAALQRAENAHVGPAGSTSSAGSSGGGSSSAVQTLAVRTTRAVARARGGWIGKAVEWIGSAPSLVVAFVLIVIFGLRRAGFLGQDDFVRRLLTAALQRVAATARMGMTMSAASM